MPAVSPLERAALALLLLLQAAALVWEARETGITADEPSHLISARQYWRGQDNLQPRDMPPAIKIVGGWVPRFLFTLPEPRAEARATNHEWMISSDVLGQMPAAEVGRLIFWSRLPLLVFPLALAGLVWWWGRQLHAPSVALALAALVAFEPTALGHGALFKNDLASAGGLLAFAYRAWCYWRRPDAVRCVWLGAALVFALLTKLSMIPLLAVAPALILWRERSLARALALVLAALSALWLATLGDPSLYVDGVRAILNSNATPNAVWFWGALRPGGDWRYFLGAALVKAPFALLALLPFGVARCREPFVLIPLAGYFTLASATSLHFGFRLIMPCLPFAVLALGSAPRWLLRAGAAGVMVASALTFPYGLSYFNAIGGPPEKAWFYLADSNLDWGQDLPRAGAWARREQVQFISTYYFGNDHPRRFFAEEKYQALAPPWDPKYAEGDVLQPKPGLYAVSVNMLTGHFFAPRYRDYFARFRAMRPVATHGGVFIYLVDYRP